MTREEEHALIERAIAGERSAAGALIRYHQGSLYAYILRMSGRPEMAEDIVQDAFVRALKNIDRFDFRFRFSTWIFTIAKRLYVNACQKHKPTYDSDIVRGRADKRLDRPDAPTIEHEVSSNIRTTIDEALECLSDVQREIIVLFHQLSWPIAHIAEHLDMPEGTIKSHLHRGRQRLRAHLSESSIDMAHIAETLSA